MLRATIREQQATIIGPLIALQEIRMAVILARGRIASRFGTPRILPLAPFGGFGLTTFAGTNQARRKRIQNIFLWQGG